MLPFFPFLIVTSFTNLEILSPPCEDKRSFVCFLCIDPKDLTVITNDDLFCCILLISQWYTPFPSLVIFHNFTKFNRYYFTKKKLPIWITEDVSEDYPDEEQERKFMYLFSVKMIENFFHFNGDYTVTPPLFCLFVTPCTSEWVLYLTSIILHFNRNFVLFLSSILTHLSLSLSLSLSRNHFHT